MRISSKTTYLLIIGGVFLSLLLYLIESKLEYQNFAWQGKQLGSIAKVTIYSKENCHFCIKAKELLKKKNINYLNIDIGEDEKLLAQLYQETRQSTVPYIFINNKFIGGYNELLKLEETGSITALLAK